MKLTKLTWDAASTLAVDALGLDATATGLSSDEGIAASLRRAASFLCPTSPGRLVDAVMEALKPLHEEGLLREAVANTLDQLVASGDLLELRQESQRSTRLVYLAPPSYIERMPGTYLLLGVRPYGAPLIEGDLAGEIDYEGHTRVLRIASSDAEEELRSCGLSAVPKDRWVSRPRRETPTDLIRRCQSRLDVAGEAGHLEGLVLLDPAANVRYYRGRWRAPTASDTGDFVARRPQAYGADLWCLIRIQSGLAQRLIEFPTDDDLLPGRDEAWRYQAATDAARGEPQQFRLRSGGSPSDDVVLDFFSPLPGFAERYVQFSGLALGKTPGALFSIRLPAAAVEDVTTFLRDMLWMTYEEASLGS